MLITAAAFPTVAVGATAGQEGQRQPDAPANSTAAPVPSVTILDGEDQDPDGFDWNSMFGAVGAVAGAVAGFGGAQWGARQQAKHEQAQRRSEYVQDFVSAHGAVMLALRAFEPPSEPQESEVNELMATVARAASLQPSIVDDPLVTASSTVLHAASAIRKAKDEEKRRQLLQKAVRGMNDLTARARQLQD